MVDKKTKEAIIQFYKDYPDTNLTASEMAFNFGLDISDKTDRQKICQYIRDLKKVAFGTRWIYSKNKKRKFSKSQTQSVKHNFEKGTLESVVTVSFEPKTIEDLYKEHKISSEDYIIKNYWSKKQTNGDFTSSVFAVKKTVETAEPEDFVKLIEGYQSKHQPLKKSDLIVNCGITRPSCLVLHLTDFHLDKQDIFGTTLEEKKELFFSVTKKLLYRAYQSNHIDEILFVIGSDMFNSDTYYGTTTNNTPQENLTSWNHAFTEAFDIYTTTIQILTQFCNKLNVVLVPGNHDRSKSFYLAFGLKKYFEKDSKIVFDVEPKSRKVYTYGSTFIGLHHGDCKITDLPLIFAKEFSALWGQCTYHQILTGDKHHLFEKEVQGVRIRQLPSLSKEDNWHDQSNYINAVKAAMALVYDKEWGCSMVIEERI